MRRWDAPDERRPELGEAPRDRREEKRRGGAPSGAHHRCRGGRGVGWSRMVEEEVVGGGGVRRGVGGGR